MPFSASATTAMAIRRHEALAVLVCALVVAAVALLGGQVARVQSDDEWLRGYAERLLAQSVEVADSSGNLIDQTRQSTRIPCSEADIIELRLRAFRSRNVRDIGRLSDGKLVCSAAWGVLDPPAAMPQPSLIQHGTSLWTAIPSPVDPRLTIDMAARGSVIVTTAPGAFDRYANMDADIGMLVSNRDGSHLFQAFGNRAGLHPGRKDQPWYDIGSVRLLHICDTRFGLCVTARKIHTSIFSASTLPAIGLCILGLLAGSSLALALIGRRRRLQALPMQLHRALANDGLTLHYQPLRLLRDNLLTGAEVLARWRNDEGEWIPPDVFVPMCEQMRVTGLLTRQVARRALAEMGGRLRDQADFYISINVTAADIIDPTFHTFLDEQCRRGSIDARRIVLELTERSTAHHDDLAAHAQVLRGKGYRIYIDDFGTGHSNISYLTSFPVDAIKIDQRFVQSIGDNRLDHPILNPICEIACNLGIGIVAEGIEARAQADFIHSLAPLAIGQGWLLGRPTDAAHFPLV